MLVTVQDTVAPSIHAFLFPPILWPTNNRLVSVDAGVWTHDACTAAPQVTLVSISSNPDPRRTPDDIQGAAIGTDDRSFKLRAESNRHGLRIYTAVYSARDAAGNSKTANAYAVVPGDNDDHDDDHHDRDHTPGNGRAAVTSLSLMLALVTAGCGGQKDIRKDAAAVPTVAAVLLLPQAAVAVGIRALFREHRGRLESPFNTFDLVEASDPLFPDDEQIKLHVAGNEALAKFASQLPFVRADAFYLYEPSANVYWPSECCTAGSRRTFGRRSSFTFAGRVKPPRTWR